MKKQNRIWHLHIFILTTIALLPTFVFSANTTQFKTELLKEITNYPEELLGLEWCQLQVTRQEQWICTVYHNLEMQPIWVNTNGPTEQGKRIYSTLEKVTSDGLTPEDYGVSKITALWESKTVAQLAKLDIAITTGLLGYIHDMQEGRFAPKFKNPELFDQAGNLVFNPIESLFEARTSSDIGQYLVSLAPAHQHYRALKKELKHHRNIADNGGWPVFPSSVTLRSGDTNNAIPTLRQLLSKTGDYLTTTTITPNLYDDELVAAVKQFQGRHHLKVDGIIGNNTRRSLNTPVEKRIQQIILNMERWRWMKHDLGSKYVLVDIAGFNLQGVVDDSSQIEMRVIVGTLHHETPIFSDTIKYIEFNPFWNITPGIARNEMLPDLRKDNNYLSSKHIKLFSNWKSDGEELDPLTINWNEISRKQISRFKLRQEPGPWNALGVVKFVFPNKYSVYLHDTPGQNLFEEANRAFSHGCIRLNKPQQLAQFLLGFNDAGWTDETIQRVIENKKRKVIKLKEPIPVHLVYQTAWVNKNGVLHFSKDIYGRDKKLTEALFEIEEY